MMRETEMAQEFMTQFMIDTLGILNKIRLRV